LFVCLGAFFLHKLNSILQEIQRSRAQERRKKKEERRKKKEERRKKKEER